MHAHLGECVCTCICITVVLDSPAIDEGLQASKKTFTKLMSQAILRWKRVQNRKIKIVPSMYTWAKVIN